MHNKHLLITLKSTAMQVAKGFAATMLVAFATGACVQAAEALPMAQDPIVEKRLIAISEELRCLVCQNESLASSRAELANDLREEVRKLIAKGDSDADIKTYLVDRYGDFVLYRPEVKPLTWLLWFGPFMLLLAGLVAMALYLRARRSSATGSRQLTAADRQKVQSLLNTGDAP